MLLRVITLPIVSVLLLFPISSTSANVICEADPCFQAARVPSSCCPSAALIPPSSTTTLQDEARRLSALVNTVCIDTCIVPIFQDYRKCLQQTSNPAGQAALRLLPGDICIVQCVQRAGGRLEDLANCSTVQTLSQECIESIQALPDAIGQRLSSAVGRCTNVNSTGPAPTPQPFQRPAQAPLVAATPASNGGMGMRVGWFVVICCAAMALALI